MIIIHMFMFTLVPLFVTVTANPQRRSTPFSRLTSGSAMMIRILRSDAVVKLANRLLRTYSPGLLSGSTLMGIMAGGPFSPWGQQTGGMGGLLYPFPTGEATEVCKKREEKQDGKQLCSVKHRTDWATDKSANTELLRSFQTWTSSSQHVEHSKTVQRAPACPGSALSFLMQHQTEHVEMKTLQPWTGVFLL